MSSMTTALRTRPSAETFSLDDLVASAWAGRIRIPSLQRGLRWSQRDVVRLFDSILNGYPVGSLLLWERPASAEHVVLGPLRISAPEGHAYYVVDGQQRITSLAAALHQDGNQDQRFQIGYDLASREFAPRPSRESVDFVPAPVLYDLTKLLGWFRERPQLEDSFDDAASVSKILRDLRIPAYVVRQDDEDVLVTIFDRMNTAGKKLTRGEVFAALHRPAGRVGEWRLGDVTEQIQARTGFGRLDDGLTMQLVLARRGPDVLREIRNEFDADSRGRDPQVTEETEEEAYLRGADAAVAAVEFVQRVCAVPHLAFLPYQHLLVVLTRYFGRHARPSRRQERLLRRFFWRAALGGPALGRGNTSGVARMMNRQIQPEEPDVSIARLLGMTTKGTRPPHPGVEPFRTNTAASKMLLCAMVELAPRGLYSGQPVTSDEVRAALGEHPTAIEIVGSLVPTGSAPRSDREAGNRLLLVAAEDRESDVLPLLVAAPPDVLDSHLLAPPDIELLVNGDASTVVSTRSQRLQAAVDAFVDRMCEWEHEDTPDLESLVMDEEDEAGRGAA